jgi:predicted dehydrogenase
MMLWAVGSRPLVASGVTAQKKFTSVEVEDLALGTIEMENGVLLQISSSMVATPEQPIVLEVYGEKGTAIYSDKPRPHVRFPGTRVKKVKPPYWGVHALQRSLMGFAKWVLDGTPYLTPAEAALPVLAVVEALYRSAETGKKETVEI